MLMSATKEARMAFQPNKTDPVSATTLPVAERMEPAPGQSMENFLIKKYGPPGLRAGNPIPPTDDPRYRAFQRELGLKPNQHLSCYVAKQPPK